jgi:hypothetical protein
MNSILERTNVACQSVREMNPNPITFKKLIGQTRRLFKENDLDILIRTKKENTLDSSEFYIMAYYDAEDDYDNETPIEVVVHHKFADTDKFSENQITDFLVQIYDAVVHEYRHRQQSVKRQYKTFSNHDQSPYKQYLKDPDELDAYALSIAIDLIRTIGPHRARRNLTRISLLSKMRQGPMLVSANLNAYIVHFGLNKMTKKLSKKVYKHLETLDARQIFK